MNEQPSSYTEQKGLLSYEEYEKRAVPLAQEAYRKQTPIIGELVTHPTIWATRDYHLARVEGEIAFVNKPFPPIEGQDPNTEVQFPLDELFQPERMQTIAGNLVHRHKQELAKTPLGKLHLLQNGGRPPRNRF